MKQRFKKFGLIILALLLGSGIVYSQSVFTVTAKCIKKTNGTVLTPEMLILVTTLQHTSDHFYNGVKEIKEKPTKKKSIYRCSKCGATKTSFDKPAATKCPKGSSSSPKHNWIKTFTPSQ